MSNLFPITNNITLVPSINTALSLPNKIPYVPILIPFEKKEQEENFIQVSVTTEQPSLIPPNNRKIDSIDEGIQPDANYGKYYNDYNIANVPTGNLGTNKAISWITFFANLESTTDNIDRSITITDCLITVSQDPIIVKQNSIGSDGTVKTYIGQDDFKIQIEGNIHNITASEGIYPNGAMIALQNILNDQGINFGIIVDSPYLNMFGSNNYTKSIDNVTGINFLVITNCEFPQEEGGYSRQKFTITAISDYYNDLDKIYSPYL